MGAHDVMRERGAWRDERRCIGVWDVRVWSGRRGGGWEASFEWGRLLCPLVHCPLTPLVLLVDRCGAGHPPSLYTSTADSIASPPVSTPPSHCLPLSLPLHHSIHRHVHSGCEQRCCHARQHQQRDQQQRAVPHRRRGWHQHPPAATQLGPSRRQRRLVRPRAHRSSTAAIDLPHLLPLSLPPLPTLPSCQ